jgi:pilus assembly protein CpaB
LFGKRIKPDRRRSVMAGNTAKRNVLVVAAILGLVTSLLVHQYLRSLKTASDNASFPIVVAMREIPPRTIISPDMISVKTVSGSQVPPGAYTRRSEVVGRVALVVLPQFSPISSENTGARNAQLGLSYVISPSMRAVTVAVDPVIAVAGFLKPGDHVDVVATFQRNDGFAVTKTVLQDVELAALDAQIQGTNAAKDANTKAHLPLDKGTATLVVSPEDAEKLVLADTQGKLRLVLRPAGDTMRVDIRGASNVQYEGKEPSAFTRPYQSATVREVKVPSSPIKRPRPSHQPPIKLPASILTAGVQPGLPPLGVSPIDEELTKAQDTQPKHEIVVIRGTQVETVTVDAPNTR